MKDDSKVSDPDRPQQSGGSERPAIMNWIIVIIGVLVLAQAAVLAWFWLKL